VEWIIDEMIAYGIFYSNNSWPALLTLKLVIGLLGMKSPEMYSSLKHLTGKRH